jgi:hypothetical protein
MIEDLAFSENGLETPTSSHVGSGVGADTDLAFKEPVFKALEPEMEDSESNRFTDKAKQLVADNYNEHRDARYTPPISKEDLFIISFSKVLMNWKAFVASSVARGLVYEVTYNGYNETAQIDVYRRINKLKIENA